MTKTDHTTDAKHLVGDFVQRAGKTFLVLSGSDVFGDERTIRLTPDDVAEFFATQARNITSGCRTLAGLNGDWRPISELAQACLNWFKVVNVVGMRQAARRRHLIPRF
jgi:hypothetical protein